MADNQHSEDIINIGDYVRFLNRNKKYIIPAIFIFLAAGYVFTVVAAPAYTLSVIFEPPSTECNQIIGGAIVPCNRIVVNKIARGDFSENFSAAMSRLNAEAVGARNTKMVIIEARRRKGETVDEDLELLAGLFEELKSIYDSDVMAERERLRGLIESMQARQRETAAINKLMEQIKIPENEDVVNVLYLINEKIEALEDALHRSPIANIEREKSQITNIKLLREPHIAGISKPALPLSLGISAIIGLLAGIVIGMCKDSKADRG